MVLKAVRRLDPHFEPVYTPPALDYDCPLLENIKLENVENRKGLLTSPASGLLSLEDLRLKGKEQLAMEITGEIEVQNIAVKDETTKSVEKYVSFYQFFILLYTQSVILHLFCYFKDPTIYHRFQSFSNVKPQKFKGNRNGICLSVVFVHRCCRRF